MKGIPFMRILKREDKYFIKAYFKTEDVVKDIHGDEFEYANLIREYRNVEPEFSKKIHNSVDKLNRKEISQKQAIEDLDNSSK